MNDFGGLVKLEEAVDGMMDEALNFRDWKATLADTIMAYDGGLTLHADNGPEEMSKTAAGQLFRKIGLPVQVLDHFSDSPELQVQMARHKLDKLSKEDQNKPILCRGRVVKGQNVFDSFLSQEYVPIGNFQILQALVESFDDADVEAYAHRAQLHNRQLAMRVVAPEWYHDLGTKDIAYTGLAVINDEIGKRSISFQVAVARIACFNYTIHSEPVFEHSHRWLTPDQIMGGINDGIKRLNTVAGTVADQLREMRNMVVDDVAGMIKISGQELGLPTYAIDAGVEWWEHAGAHENLFMMVQAVEFGSSMMTERKGFHWWRRQLAEQRIYDMGKQFQETGKLELCTCPSCHRPMNVIEMEG